MSYDVNTKQSYSSSAPVAGQSIMEILEALGGKVSSKSNPAKGQIEATFNKKVKDQSLPNRCQIRVKIVPQSAESCTVLTKTYPVDPMGSKLSFGVRGNAAQVVSDTVIAELKTKVEA